MFKRHISTIVILFAFGVLLLWQSGGQDARIHASDIDRNLGILYRLEQLESSVGVLKPTVVPVGGIIPYYGDPENLPEGWQWCNGGPLDAEAERELRLTLGGDDAHVPDLRGRTLFGADISNEPVAHVGKMFGSATHDHDMNHHHDVGGIRITDFSEFRVTVNNATFRSRDNNWWGRGSRSAYQQRDSRTGPGNGFFVWAADEDTGVVKFSQHRHGVTIGGRITVPAHLTQTARFDPGSGVQDRTRTSAESNYPPGMATHFIIRIR